MSLLQAETATDLARSDDGALIREEIEAKFVRDATPEPVQAAIRSLVEAAVAPARDLIRCPFDPLD